MKHGPIILGLLILAAGCASHLKTARHYSAVGRHEMAVYYLGGHYRTHRDDPGAKAELIRGVENAKKTIEADYQDRASRRFILAV